MRTTQTSPTFPLASVKPLEGLVRYRGYCLAQTRRAMAGRGQRRAHCPVDRAILEPCGAVEGLAYVRCPSCGSLFLADLPDWSAWAGLLAGVSRYRQSPATFHADLVQSRADHVYAPKLEWIRDTLRLQQMDHPTLLEVTTPPSPFTPLLHDSGVCAAAFTIDEMAVAHQPIGPADSQTVEVAVLLESLDRVDDPARLLQRVVERVVVGGLVFVTGLVVSGFDMAALGLRNLYLYPPDRTNGFSLQGLSALMTRAGLELLEVSTPGVLDVGVVQAHRQRDLSLTLSAFEEQLLRANPETQEAFQTFLQQQGLSSFARIVGRKP
ncbi:MAG: hypothetical protein HYY58_04335 [Candidatus Omnitrophica bacterium]|nr:hypothetical protein [Candidatus Omnitrophota bacterium]